MLLYCLQNHIQVSMSVENPSPNKPMNWHSCHFLKLPHQRLIDREASKLLQQLLIVDFLATAV